MSIQIIPKREQKYTLVINQIYRPINIFYHNIFVIDYKHFTIACLINTTELNNLHNREMITNIQIYDSNIQF